MERLEAAGQVLGAVFKPNVALTPRQKWIFGLVNLGSVVVFWVLSSFLVSDLFEDEVYRKPFLITYINTACFSLYLIPYLRYEGIGVREFVAKIRHDYSARNAKLGDIETANYGSGSDSSAGASMDINEAAVTEITESTLEIPELETIALSFQFCILWFAANLVTNSSLSYTSVASQTILSSTSSFFTLIIGFLYAMEKINKNKIYGIILCFSGVVVVAKVDSSSTNPSSSNKLVFFGNMLALVGAVIYGFYTILLKVKTVVKNSVLQRNLNTHLFFAFVGLFCLVGLWPVIIILHVTGLESFALPSDSHILTLLLINTSITFVSDFCWCKAVILTSPLTVTVGLSLTIPLAMVGDWFIKGFHLNWPYVIGATIVTVGFLIINNDEKEEFVHEHET